jgi:hypothetical protein
MSSQQQAFSGPPESDVRLEARAEAVRALRQYHSPLNRNITPTELEALMALDTSEGAGVAGDFSGREDSAVSRTLTPAEAEALRSIRERCAHLDDSSEAPPREEKTT